MYAAREGNLACVKFILETYVPKDDKTTSTRNVVNLDARSKDEWTALMFSACNGYLLTTEWLAKNYKCNINAHDRFKRTALHWCGRYNEELMCRLLMELEID